MTINSRVITSGILTIILASTISEGLQWIIGGVFNAEGIISRLVFIATTIVLAYLSSYKKIIFIFLLLAIFATVIYALTTSTIIAWALISLYFVILLWIARKISTQRTLIVRLAIYIIIGLIAGVTTIALEQIQTRFSQEEFFVALQGLALVLTWGLLAFSINLWIRLASRLSVDETKANLAYYISGFAILIIAGSFLTIKSYQYSFYPHTAPGYEGVSASSPYICGEIDQLKTNEYPGEMVYDQILELVEANPDKKSPEFGMLALGRSTTEWKELFRESILREARQRLFTQPNNSVKFSQYEAALRAYYYSRVIEEFPDLFSQSEVDEIQAWFKAINQRALTVEWVDLMYAIAYNKKPEGPYENQEIGAGLLSLLESVGLADPGLSEKNRSYLDSNSRGWEVRFRNTDDAAVYQPEWINNALFQTYYTGEVNIDNLIKSIQWLLLQSLPDGSPLKYNHVGATKIADTAYQGASLVENITALWLAGNSSDYLKSKGGYLSAIPGVEAPVMYLGKPPKLGSCLIFGDSGVPNQIGPLAPDKIVFRDGWTDESRYMLTNLRFTGWHRYKATNTITMLYQGGTLVTENNIAPSSLGWLPIGRSLFRDKRIPREHLNGLIIEKIGLSNVIYTLTGIGSSWSQDPPFYAKVKEFKTTPEMDYSHTVIKDWHGWSHNRQVFFHHEGPIIVVDKAVGNKDHEAAIIWHVIGQAIGNGKRITLTAGIKPAEMLLIGLQQNQARINIQPYGNEDDNLIVQYITDNSGALSLITIFLDGEWTGAEGQISDDSGQLVLTVTKGSKHIVLPIEDKN